MSGAIAAFSYFVVLSRGTSAEAELESVERRRDTVERRVERRQFEWRQWFRIAGVMDFLCQAEEQPVTVP